MLSSRILLVPVVATLLLSRVAAAIDDGPHPHSASFLTDPVAIATVPRLHSTPPFRAWVWHSTVYIRTGITLPSPIQGVLHRGDQVTVTNCTPDCNSRGSKAHITPWGGTISAVSLRPLPTDEKGMLTAWNASYVYGRTFQKKTPVYESADDRSKVVEKLPNEYRLAFVPDGTLLGKGWLRRPTGDFMRQSDIKMFTVSEFRGVHNPEGKIAFAHRVIRIGPVGGAVTTAIQRHSHRKVLATRPGKILIDEGWAPRNKFIVVTPVRRPWTVRADRKWVHVDLKRQVLTAYEGDKHVFSTLVSTGKSGRRSTRTRPGDYFVYAKTIHSSMRGRPWDDYFAEEVPYVMHFDWGRALHGTYWHDSFGTEKSHGCVNLSMQDAKWLFEWADPQLPDGWHTVVSQNRKLPTVAVIIDK